MSSEDFYQTIIVGGGQSGLAAGYFLSQKGENFIILDENKRTGEAWRKRWDSLRLFTPSQFNGLPGMPFPKPENYFPTKEEVAGYLEEYANTFHLPIRHGVKVSRLHRAEHGYQLTAGNTAYHANNVIVATGPFHFPHTPSFAKALDPGIFQLHSSDYKNPKQVPVESVLVVGAGNSGVEIALELCKAGKRVWLSGRDVGHIPANTLGKAFGGKPYWWFISRVLSVDTPIGRKMRSNVLYHGNPLIRANRQEVTNAGIESTPRVAGIQSGKLQLEDGHTLPIDGVVWATGFHPDFSWIDLPVFDDHGYPRHERGIVQEAPGLSFVGLHFQSALTSALMGGVGADAKFVVSKMPANGHTT
jgi:putative flavoprotein involved in K+ transport